MLRPSRSASLRIVLAAGETPFRMMLKRYLHERLGHQVVGEAATGTDMIRMALLVEADVLVFDVGLPRLNGLDAFAEVQRVRPVAGLALVGEDAHAEACPMLDRLALPYVFKPIDLDRLRSGILRAKGHFEQRHQAAEAVDSCRQAGQDRALIEEAKGVLMAQHGLTEPAAHRRLQRTSMNRRLPMVKVAREVLDTAAPNPALRPRPRGLGLHLASRRPQVLATVETR